MVADLFNGRVFAEKATKKPNIIYIYIYKGKEGGGCTNPIINQPQINSGSTAVYRRDAMLA